MTCDGATTTHKLDVHDCLLRRGGSLIANAMRGQPAALVAAAARMSGTAARSLSDVLVARLTDLPEGRRRYRCCAPSWPARCRAAARWRRR